MLILPRQNLRLLITFVCFLRALVSSTVLDSIPSVRPIMLPTSVVHDEENQPSSSTYRLTIHLRLHSSCFHCLFLRVRVSNPQILP